MKEKTGFEFSISQLQNVYKEAKVTKKRVVLQPKDEANASHQIEKRTVERKRLYERL